MARLSGLWVFGRGLARGDSEENAGSAIVVITEAAEAEKRAMAYECVSLEMWDRRERSCAYRKYR